MMWYSLKQTLTISTEELGFPGGSVVEKPPANSGDSGLIPLLRRSPGERNDNPLEYSCLENPTDRGTLGTVAPCMHVC